MRQSVFIGRAQTEIGNPGIISYRNRMEQPTTRTQPVGKQQTRWRFFWFVAGAGINYLLISTPFHYLDKHTELPIWALSSASVGIGTTFFFFWNYFINFRTDSRKRDALPRYLGAVVIMWILSSTTLTILKHFDMKMSFSVGKFPLDLDIVATQFFLAGLKFFLYHKWVFPIAKDSVSPIPNETR